VTLNYPPVIFTPLERPAIHGGDNIIIISIPHRKGGVKATSFLTGFNIDGRLSGAEVGLAEILGEKLGKKK
jgi:hypothetical protein